MNNMSKVLDFTSLMGYYVVTGDERFITLAKKVQAMATKEVLDSQFLEIENWVNSKGFVVSLETDAEDRVEWEEQKVYINSRNRIESRYHTLLHECGHILIAQAWQDFDRDHPMYACSTDARTARSKAYKVSTIAEELEAWKRGRRLARRFKHYVDDSKYDAHMTESIMSYIEWATA
jgi:hypothetical protein